MKTWQLILIIVVSVATSLAGAIGCVVAYGAVRADTPASGDIGHRKLTSVHTKYSISFPADPTKDESGENWIVPPDKNRTESATVVLVRNGLSYWSFNKKSREYTAGHLAAGEARSLDPEKWDTPANQLQTWRDAGADIPEKKISIKLHGVDTDATEYDVPAVTLKNGARFGPQKYVITLDAKTGLIRSMTREVHDASSGQLVQVKSNEYDYNVGIPDSTFTFQPPDGAVRVPEK